ncbi:hypothetical protein AYO40_06695 [Planctomycetaceae bacterium SCGC AG-212-D15]|nr:hypothetical protein AYO40_06695 [Planctomycetaceae bacterium SCGC AG-212-D15]
MSPKALLAIFLAIGAASFAGFFFLLSGQGQGPGADLTTETRKKDEGEKKPAETAKPKVAPPPPQTARELRRWKLPADPEHGVVLDDKAQHIRDLAFDPTGTRLTAVTRRNAYCFELADQNLLQSYHQENIKLLPDGVQLAITDKAKEEMRIVVASSGKEMARFRLNDKKRLEAKALEQAKQITPRPFATAISLKRQAILYDLGTREVQEFEGPNKKIFKVGVGSAYPSRLTCITYWAAPWDDDEPLVLSSDESMLLVKSWVTIEVCYWQTDQLLLSERGGGYGYHNPRFTPDNRHVIVVCHEGYADTDSFLRNPLNKGWIATADSVDLFDIARKKRAGLFRPPNTKPNTLTCAALSPDGKTLAISFERTIAFYDAQAAFPSARPGAP